MQMITQTIARILAVMRASLTVQIAVDTCRISLIIIIARSTTNSTDTSRNNHTNY